MSQKLFPAQSKQVGRYMKRENEAFESIGPNKAIFSQERNN